MCVAAFSPFLPGDGLGVGVKPPGKTRQVTDAEIRNQYENKTNHVGDHPTAVLPAEIHAKVEVNCVSKPGDKRPGFLGVPAPVAAPGSVRPYRPEKNTKREQRPSDLHAAIGEVLEVLLSRKRA